jgi:hypothetical protein
LRFEFAARIWADVVDVKVDGLEAVEAEIETVPMLLVPAGIAEDTDTGTADARS